MDTFETMVLNLRLEEQDKDDVIKKERQTHTTKCFLDIKTFKNGVPEIESIDLQKDLVFKRVNVVPDASARVLASAGKEIPPLFVYESQGSVLTMNDLTMMLAPHIARMGIKGWEVVDFKVSTINGYQVQALLKRKVKK